MNLSPSQALHNLYQASRMAPAVAGDHEVLKVSAEVIHELIKEIEKMKLPCEKEVCEKKGD